MNRTAPLSVYQSVAFRGHTGALGSKHGSSPAVHSAHRGAHRTAALRGSAGPLSHAPASAPTLALRADTARHIGQQPCRRVASARRNTIVVRAIEVSGPGGVPQEPTGGEGNNFTSEIIDNMKDKIAAALEAESVTIADTYGDNRHVSIDVVASSFEGKTSVQRQRLVYKAIWAELQDAVHAVDAMTTKTPEEAAK